MQIPNPVIHFTTLLHELLEFLYFLFQELQSWKKEGKIHCYSNLIIYNLIFTILYRIVISVQVTNWFPNCISWNCSSMKCKRWRNWRAKCTRKRQKGSRRMYYWKTCSKSLISVLTKSKKTSFLNQKGYILIQQYRL